MGSVSKSQELQYTGHKLAQCNNTKLSTMMGLAADLNYPWIANDNSLYLWDYTHPAPELIRFEEQQQITAVQFVTLRVAGYHWGDGRLVA